jgi:hypothetical protein
MPTRILYVSSKKWRFLCELAAENNTQPEQFAEQLLANKITELQDEVQYANELQQELDAVAEFMEKSVEEALS